MRGYNATIFAYGQTGSGKTHTMEGYKYRATAAAAATATTTSRKQQRSGATGRPADGGRVKLVADFASGAADPSELGLTPRVIDELYRAIAARRNPASSSSSSSAETHGFAYKVKYIIQW